MALATLTGFLGANSKADPRLLGDGICVSSLNQKPSEDGRLRPWRVPLAIAGPVVPAGRQTLYRMGRDAASTTNFWLSWPGIVHAVRGFDTLDPTERTYLTGQGTPKWTDNIIGLAGTPYPTAYRELAVPQPTLAPSVVMNADGPSGDARALYYVFTWVNDIGWESAPSPPFLAPAVKPGAIMDLTISESVPAGNYGVNRVRWYRQQVAGDTGTAPYFFLREYAEGVGGMQDDARALGDEIATETWLVPPSDGTWLTICWNEFASMLSGKTVRFCESKFLYAWPIEYEYILDSTPIAQAAFLQRLIVFTTAGAEVFTGQSPEGMDQKKVKLPVLASQRSLVVGDSFCIWAAEDGLWFLDASGPPRNLVEKCLTGAQWKALLPSTISGQLLQIGEKTMYFGSYNDGTLKGFIVDLSNPDGFFPLAQGYTAAFWDTLMRTLFVLDGSTLKQWDAGASFMTTTVRSRINRQQADTEGEWLELIGDGSTQVKVIVDGTTEYDHALTNGEHRLHDGTEGREWQLEVSTSDSLLGLVVE